MANVNNIVDKTPTAIAGKWAKIFLWGSIGLIGLGVAVIIFRKQIEKIFTGENKDEKKTGRLTEKDIDYNKLSYATSWYYQKADALYQIMDGWGTLDSSIMRELNMLKNKNDYYMLIVAFGTRDGRDLPAYFAKEITPSGQYDFNQLLKKIGVQ